MLLRDIDRPTIEDIKMWGFDRLVKFFEILNDHYFDGLDEDARFFCVEIMDKLDDIKIGLDRLRANRIRRGLDVDSAV